MIIPGDYAQANLRFGGTGLPSGAEVTLGLNVELWSGDATAAAEEVRDTFLATTIPQFISSVIDLLEVEVKFGPNLTGPSGTSPAGNNMTGAALGSTPNVAWLIQKQTGFGGRAGRGRFYLPGVPEAYADANGNVASNYASLLTVQCEDWRTSLTAAGLVPTLLHGPGSPISQPLPITGLVCDSRVATQRRRLRR